MMNGYWLVKRKSLYVLALTAGMTAAPLSYANTHRQVSLMIGGTSTGDLKTERPSAEVNTSSGTSYTLLLNQLQRTAETNIDLQYEMLISQNTLTVKAPADIITSQEAELTSRHLHIGGTYEWRHDRITPYVGGTIGASHLSLSGAGADTFLGYSVAGGLKFPLGENLNLRIEARAIGVNLSSDTDFFCSSAQGTCLINIRSNTWWQQQLSIGLGYRF
ncbi:MAG TPA: outer membrane beta-barrel protein [Marinagarivorans sp.]